MRVVSTSVLLFLALMVTGQGHYQLPRGLTRDQINPSWIYVKATDASALADLQNEVATLHIKDPNHPSVLDGLCKIKVKPGEDPIQLIEKLRERKGIVYAEPVVQYEPLYTPSDPSNVSEQYYLEQIKAYDAWDVTRGDDDIIIGISDAGIDLDHEDLSSNLWTNEADPIDGEDNDGNGYVDDYYGFDFSDADSDPNADGSSHGTRVAGIASASTDNSTGISGVGFNSKIAALKGFTTSTNESINIFETVIYAADNGIQVLNLSWGSVRDPLQSEQDIIDYAALEKDVAILVAAGNDGAKENPEAKFYPASYKHVLSVGATDANDNRWALSTYNYEVDIMAPGEFTYTTENDNLYGSYNGTSFAAPMVAGAAALVRAQFPELTALQVLERLRVTSDDIYDVGANSSYEGKLGFGRLNVFNAVSNSAVKSLRVLDFTASTARGDQLFFGDTVHISLEITNYLDEIDNPQIFISSPENQFSPVESEISLSSLGKLENTSATIEIVLNSDLEPESALPVRLDIVDGAYVDFQHLELETSADYVDFGASFQMTIAGNGNIGFADSAYTEGIGIRFGEENILDIAGIILATSETTVSDNVINDYATLSRDQDFVPLTNFKLINHPAADLFAYSEFKDTAKNVVVELSTYGQNDSDFLILRARVINDDAATLNNLSVGIFADFDLSNHLQNRAEFDMVEDYIFAQTHSEDLFAGIKVIADGAQAYSALDMDGQNGNTADIDLILTDALKFEYLHNQQVANAGAEGSGNDVAVINGSTFSSIIPTGHEFVNILLAAGNSRAELETQFDLAEDLLQEVVEKPRVLETVFSCEGSAVTLDPTSGDLYNFYQDAQGTVLLHSGTSFTTGVINQDTTFFVQNLDGSYPSDLFQYQVMLVEEVADFSIDPDTLYLDNAINVVSFTDQSFQAIEWSWGFGQGTTSTLQHPSLVVNTAGEYTVTLYVENDIGCTDTKERTLVVAERPAPPSFTDFNICPLESIQLSDESADYLTVYEDPSDLDFIARGTDVEVGPFSNTTTLYVSGTFGQFESDRVPVLVNVEEFPIGFEIAIDTNSVAHQIVISAPEGIGSVEWFVNGTSQGTASEISVDSSNLSVTIRLEQLSISECTFSETQDFVFSESPLPTQTDVTLCESGPLTILPGNGHIFGFYEDQELTQLIKKGTELTIDSDGTVYVVGLDDGLPSDPIPVVVTIDQFEIDITAEINDVGEKKSTSFSVQTEATVERVNWFVDGIFVDASLNPTLFFDEGVYEVVAQAISTNLCEAYDTLDLDLVPPLGLESALTNPTFYPNPTSGRLALHPVGATVEVYDLTGNLVSTYGAVRTLDISHLQDGIYLFRAISHGKTVEQRVAKFSD